MTRGGFLSAEERAALKAVLGQPSETHGVARRVNAILLLDKGWSCAQVSAALYLDDDTLRTWLKHYRAGGLDELTLFDWHGRPGHLSQAQEAELSAHLGERLYRDTGLVALRRTSGRQRLNLHGLHHGALNLENFHCPLVQAEKINTASTIALFEKLEASNSDKSQQSLQKMDLQMDLSHRRQCPLSPCRHHAVVVRQLLARSGRRIKLTVLPAYAPHLNAIERLGGILHRKVAHNRFYESFDLFARAINDFFRRRLPQGNCSPWRGLSPQGMV